MRHVIVKINRPLQGTAQYQRGADIATIEPGEYHCTRLARQTIIHTDTLRNVFLEGNAYELLRSGAVVITDTNPPPVEPDWRRIMALAVRIPKRAGGFSRLRNGVDITGAEPEAY